MNKHQKALNELKEFVHSELDGTRMLDKYLGYIEDLKELVDQTKTPTLEEVKKEWEELGYKLYDGKNCMELYNKQKKYVIEVSFTRKSYAKYDKKYGSLLLTLQEHNLLTKTFRALKWMD